APLPPRGAKGERQQGAHVPARQRQRRSTSFAACTTASTVKPNFFCSSFSGALAPNVFMPIRLPSGPTYSLQPNVLACSTETRALTADGSTCSRYSGCLRQWYSKISHDGMLTTRERTPAATSCSCASTHSDTSLPVASSTTSGV